MFKFKTKEWKYLFILVMIMFFGWVNATLAVHFNHNYAFGLIVFPWWGIVITNLVTAIIIYLTFRFFDYVSYLLGWVKNE